MDKGQTMTLTFGTHSIHIHTKSTIRMYCTNVQCKDFNSFYKEDAGDSRLSLAKSREICC